MCPSYYFSVDPIWIDENMHFHQIGKDFIRNVVASNPEEARDSLWNELRQEGIKVALIVDSSTPNVSKRQFQQELNQLKIDNDRHF